MNKVNWDEFRCRCSAIVKMMASSRSNPQLTDVQAKRLLELEGKDVLTEKQKSEMADLNVKKANLNKIILSDGCIEYLMECYAWETMQMIPVGKESLDLMQLKKGKLGEREAGLLLSVVDGVLYETHKERIKSDYLSGEIDFFLGKSIYEATNVTDTKNAFDYPGFLKKINNGLENGQREQVAGYGEICHTDELYVANCLVSFTPDMVDDMKWKVLRKLNCATTESPEFIEKWPEFERSMNFDKIPPAQRVHKIKVEPFTDSEKQKVYDRVKHCREFLWKFDEERQKLN